MLIASMMLIGACGAEMTPHRPPAPGGPSHHPVTVAPVEPRTTVAAPHPDAPILAGTECALGDDGLNDQEREFLEAIGNVEQWLIGTGFGGDDNLLLISFDDGLQVEGESAS